MASRRVIVAVASILAGTALSIIPATQASAATLECVHNTVKGTLDNIVPTDTNGSTSCFLVQNDSGTGVSALQDALKTCYGKSIAIDGDFGPATKSALKSVQSSLGVTADGEYGPNTHGVMKFASADSPQASACRHV